MGSFDHPEAANDSDAAIVLASFDAPREKDTIAAPLVVRRNPSMLPSSLPSSPASATDLAAASASGVNSWVADVAGTPMNVATNASNLLKSGAESAYLAVGKVPPTWLDPDKPENVPGTSEWIKRKTREAGAASVIDAPRPNGQDLSALHTVGEAVGPGAIAGGLSAGVNSLMRPATTGNIIAPVAPPRIIGPFENSPESMGSGRAVDPRLATASPQLQQAVRQAAQETGGAVNPTAFENHLEADQHGIQLTEGQATRDPVAFSNEQNSTHGDIVKRLNAQNEQMTDAFDEIRRTASPGHVQNDPIENGQIAVDRLKAYDEPIRADITAKYEAAKAASAKGDLQMDGSSFVSDANAALKPQSKFRFLPGSVKGILDDVANADGKMTLDDFQAYSTQLGNEIAKARRAGDGNAEAAITKVYSALQDTNPIDAETTQAKALFDTARSAAKTRFDELKADPAYRAAVDDVSLSGVARGEPSALADKFLDRYALQAPKANVDRMMGKLDEDAQQAVASHTLSTIRKSAIPASGNVTPAGFNSALAKYSPKLNSLIQPETQESLESLGRVISNAKTPPPGHFVNYSKSGVIMNAAQDLGGSVLNAKTLGMGVPILKNIAGNALAKRALAPGAGLTKLPTPPP